jgi:hypothetical protein
VFFKNDQKTLGWKIVLRKEPKSWWVVVDTYDDCIHTHGIVSKLEVPLEFWDLNNNRTIVGVIELNRKDIILVAESLHGSLGIDYVA